MTLQSRSVQLFSVNLLTVRFCALSQVSGEALLRGLKAALAAAPDAAAAAAPLEGYTLAVRLAGVLGLDALCEACVDGKKCNIEKILIEECCLIHFSPGGASGGCAEPRCSVRGLHGR